MNEKSRRVVVYFRTRPLEPSFSDQALKEQRVAVTRWLSDNPASVVAEYSELEIDGMSRPRLADAVAKCKASSASLLIARVEAIGTGLRFEPRIVTVPVLVAPRTIREIGHVIPCPHNALPGLSLYFPDYQGMRASPVYLCNNAELQLENLRITISKITSKIEDSLGAGSMLPSVVSDPVRADASSNLSTLPPFSAVLIGHYDPMIDGEAIASYAISFIFPSGQQQQASALLGTGALPARFIKLS
jgi:hypothetical protein